MFSLGSVGAEPTSRSTRQRWEGSCLFRVSGGSRRRDEVGYRGMKFEFFSIFISNLLVKMKVIGDYIFFVFLALYLLCVSYFATTRAIMIQYTKYTITRA